MTEDQVLQQFKQFAIDLWTRLVEKNRTAAMETCLRAGAPAEAWTAVQLRVLADMQFNAFIQGSISTLATLNVLNAAGGKPN